MLLIPASAIARTFLREDEISGNTLMHAIPNRLTEGYKFYVLPPLICSALLPFLLEFLSSMTLCIKTHLKFVWNL